jgi:PTS system nitrogen regulatory IIA component
MDLNIQQVAERLNTPVETILRWIRQGKIPMQHNRGDYAIRREMLEQWAAEHNLKAVTTPQAPAACSESEFDGIAAAMRRGGFFYDVGGDTKEVVMRSAVACIPNIDPDERDLVLEKLLEREQLASTGIGHGIALPHPRNNPGILLGLPQITTCFLSQAVSFEAIDHQPVSILMVLLSCSTKQHLSMLSKLAYHLRDKDFRDYLLTMPESSGIFSRIEQME